MMIAVHYSSLLNSVYCISSDAHKYAHRFNPLPHNAVKSTLTKILVISIFSISCNVFYHIKEGFHYLSHIRIVICKCFQFAKIYVFVVW